MGFLSNIFGQSSKQKSNSSVHSSIQTEYNIMQEIQLDSCQKYSNSSNFILIENGIYQDLNDEEDTQFRMVISYYLNSEDTQYPLEDILDKYYLYVSDFLENEQNAEENNHKIELAGTKEDLLKAQEILGKKVYNQDYLDEAGEVRTRLVVE